MFDMPITAAIVLSALLGAPSGEIAFLSGAEQEDRTVSIIDVESREVRRIGNGNRDDAPVWSPDGKRIAFSSITDLNGETGMAVFVVNADGSNLRPLNHGKSYNRNPAWAPDNLTLAYSAGNGEPICVPNEEGGRDCFAVSGLHDSLFVYNLADDTETEWSGGIWQFEASDDKNRGRPFGFMRPVWVEGPLLLFAVLAGGEEMSELGDIDIRDPSSVERSLLAIGITGSLGNFSMDLFVVTKSTAVPFPPVMLPSRGEYAEWAPHPDPKGRALVFESNDGGDREIFIITKKGPYDLSNHRAADWNPVWAPNGDFVAFESFRDGRRGIYRVNPDTALVSPIAVGEDYDNWHPTWSPDSEWIAYVSNRTGSPELFVTNRNGEDTIQITDSKAENLAPAWRPKGDK
ncbi:MAG: PD40 domain-containing protein [Candidatus Hydrogenedentes bacterium]|nr:PD40 domain-containing protein [Candidatus Hydrogenedentota bacterium]